MQVAKRALVTFCRTVEDASSHSSPPKPISSSRNATTPNVFVNLEQSSPTSHPSFFSTTGRVKERTTTTGSSTKTTSVTTATTTTTSTTSITSTRRAIPSEVQTEHSIEPPEEFFSHRLTTEFFIQEDEENDGVESNTLRIPSSSSVSPFSTSSYDPFYHQTTTHRLNKVPHEQERGGTGSRITTATFDFSQKMEEDLPTTPAPPRKEVGDSTMPYPSRYMDMMDALSNPAMVRFRLKQVWQYDNY